MSPAGSLLQDGLQSSSASHLLLPFQRAPILVGPSSSYAPAHGAATVGTRCMRQQSVSTVRRVQQCAQASGPASHPGGQQRAAAAPLWPQLPHEPPRILPDKQPADGGLVPRCCRCSRCVHMPDWCASCVWPAEKVAVPVLHQQPVCSSWA